MRLLMTLAVVLVAAAASNAANAVTCYTLIDRSDKLLYQNSLPPVDMSDQGAAARESLRRRNEYLLVADVDNCPSIAAVEGATGYRPESVDEIVGGMRSYLSSGGVSRRGSMVSGSAGGGSVGGSSSAPAPARGGRSSY